jgi:uncharacterized membrane-anchored protein
VFRAAGKFSAFVILLAVTSASARAQEQMPDTEQPAQPMLGWTQGADAPAPIGDGLAEIDLGPDFIYLDAEGTRKLLELTQNPTTGLEVATVAPVSEQENWFVIFEFDPIGYVADDDQDALDAEEILGSIRAGTEAANEVRRERGWTEMNIVGWHEAPHYDARTNNLSWAIIGESADGRAINRIVKLLGRRGVMTATLVAGPDELDHAIAATNGLLDGYRFQPGQTYAEYVPGTDKLAEIGLAALIVGGGAAALVKSGLLAKLWKPILVALAAVGAGLKRIFFGGRSAAHDPEQPIT